MDVYCLLDPVLGSKTPQRKKQISAMLPVQDIGKIQSMHVQLYLCPSKNWICN